MTIAPNGNFVIILVVIALSMVTLLYRVRVL